MDPADHSAKSTPGSNSSLGAAISSPPERSNSQSGTNKPGHIASHRQSFAENHRYPPPSPRAQRHPSFTQQALQDLLISPPSNRHANPRYAGRDWRDISLGELGPEETKWASFDTSVEDATMVRYFSWNSCLSLQAATDVNVAPLDPAQEQPQQCCIDPRDARF